MSIETVIDAEAVEVAPKPKRKPAKRKPAARKKAAPRKAPAARKPRTRIAPDPVLDQGTRYEDLPEALFYYTRSSNHIEMLPAERILSASGVLTKVRPADARMDFRAVAPGQSQGSVYRTRDPRHIAYLREQVRKNLDLTEIPVDEDPSQYFLPAATKVPAYKIPVGGAVSF